MENTNMFFMSFFPSHSLMKQYLGSPYLCSYVFLFIVREAVMLRFGPSAACFLRVCFDLMFTLLFINVNIIKNYVLNIIKNSVLSIIKNSVLKYC